jgi:hypothetical protein
MIAIKFPPEVIGVTGARGVYQEMQPYSYSAAFQKQNQSHRMKQTLTFIALLACGASNAQSPQFPLTRLYRTEAARATFAAVPGPDDVLRNHRSVATASKTAATAYRLTGYSRFDIAHNEFLDSASFSYSGRRGSEFTNEQENLHGGDWWYLSAPDHYFVSKEGSMEDGSEVSRKYNAANQVTEEITRQRSYTRKSVFTYDPDGLLSSLVEFDSTNMGWTASYRYTYTYDAAKRRVQDNITDLSTSQPSGRVEYRYTAAGLQDTLRIRMWDGAGWITSYLTTAKFSAAGLMQQRTTHTLGEDMELYATERMDYTYDGSSRLKTNVTSVFAEGVWVPSYRDSLGYTGTKSLYSFMKSDIYDVDKSSWTPLREWSYSLNAQSRWSIEWFKTPNSNGVLEYKTKTLISYNANGLVSDTKTYTYDRTAQDFPLTNDEVERFQYEPFQTTSVPGTKSPLQLALYPNPVGNTLRLETGGETIVQLDVYSLAGQCVISRRNEASQMDVSQLPAGSYILQVQLKDRADAQVLRFVKL